ncbi:MAG: tRNA (adenosine(37)-N6)-threonylcarbamoyltransferase complex dimerization subunit type 1 TsaB [Deltaproteobacteria bacterium]|nr:tRNA (adenosine(37)-N6)-threonylcarbamoyltransferase complex dimerization subunit type 1 TsaB [Deltaproteobacteria bacterium]
MIGSVALTDDNELLAEYQIGIKATYSDTLFPMIDHILKNANVSIQEVDAFALAKGPGSFTSLRIGISVIKGLALANNKPVIAIPSLDALAHNICFSNMLICPLIDARRDEVYTAFYKREEGHTLKKLTPDRAIVPEILLDEIREKVVFLGDGTDLYKDLIIRKLKEKALFSPLHLKYPRASAIAQLAFKKLNVNEVSDIEVMTPLYVRPPEAETKWVKKKIEC